MTGGFSSASVVVRDGALAVTGENRLGTSLPVRRRDLHARRAAHAAGRLLRPAWTRAEGGFDLAGMPLQNEFMRYDTVGATPGAADVNWEYDAQVRNATFEWLSSRSSEYNDVLPHALLKRGFEFRGKRIHVIGPQGIFKPATLSIPLSIRTSIKGDYNDQFGDDGLFRYSYRRTGPDHHENVGLRSAMLRRRPLVYFHGVIEARYVAAWPVFVEKDLTPTHRFVISVDAHTQTNLFQSERVGEDTLLRRRYVTVQTRHRLHQRAFRERVLRAYRRQCSLCRLRRDGLLDAAHIAPDSEPEGVPSVSNGLALCRLHHAAFDRFFLGVRPDYIIEIRRDILHDRDGPTLKHAIQGLHHQRIALPRQKTNHPDIDLLAERYERFLEQAKAS